MSELLVKRTDAERCDRCRRYKPTRPQFPPVENGTGACGLDGRIMLGGSVCKDFAVKFRTKKEQ